MQNLFGIEMHSTDDLLNVRPRKWTDDQVSFMVEITQGIWQHLWEQDASDEEKRTVQEANRAERLRVWKKLRTIHDRMSITDKLDILTYADEDIAFEIRQILRSAFVGFTHDNAAIPNPTDKEFKRFKEVARDIDESTLLGVFMTLNDNRTRELRNVLQGYEEMNIETAMEPMLDELGKMMCVKRKRKTAQ